MIVKGDFECVSMAIYGETMQDATAAMAGYVPPPLPAIEPIPLSRALDPSNSLDPSHLAQQLLNMIPDAPPLPLVIRLMFCLKPANEDWDSPEFPYCHPDLDDTDFEFDLEKVSKLTLRPVADDISEEALNRFAENVARAVNSKVASYSSEEYKTSCKDWNCPRIRVSNTSSPTYFLMQRRNIRIWQRHFWSVFSRLMLRFPKITTLVSFRPSYYLRWLSSRRKHSCQIDIRCYESGYRPTSEQ